MQDTYALMEKDIIKACLYDNSQIQQIQAKLSPTVFSAKKYKRLYQCVLDMYEKGEDIDHVTLTLHAHEQSGMDTTEDEILDPKSMRELSNNTKPISWETYADKLNMRYEKIFVGRELAKASERVKSGAPIAEVFANVEEQMNSASIHTRKPFRSFMEAVKNEVKYIGQRSDPGYDANTFYVPLPFKTMSMHLRGFRYGALSLLGARPSHGKTTFALNCIRHSIDQGVKTMFVSIEMSESEISQKMLSLECGIPTPKLVQSKDLSEDDVDNIAKSIESSTVQYSKNFSIDDKSETPSEVIQCIQRAINDGHKFIVIDHVHELVFEERKANFSLGEAMGNFVKRLRNIAKKNNVAILALCQLNRDCERRSSKEPIMSDLGETGALERAAYSILFLYRDEVYNTGTQRRGECDVIIAKSRDSSIGLVTLDFRGDLNKFYDQS